MMILLPPVTNTFMTMFRVLHEPSLTHIALAIADALFYLEKDKNESIGVSRRKVIPCSPVGFRGICREKPNFRQHKHTYSKPKRTSHLRHELHASSQPLVLA